MADELKEIKEPVASVTDDGIRVDIPGDYWILFDKYGWSLRDEARFARRSTSNLQGFAMLIEHTLDWQLPDAEWNSIPFDKARLLKGISDFEAGAGDDVPLLPVQLERHVGTAFWLALGAAKALPLTKRP